MCAEYYPKKESADSCIRWKFKEYKEKTKDPEELKKINQYYMSITHMRSTHKEEWNNVKYMNAYGK